MKRRAASSWLVSAFVGATGLLLADSSEGSVTPVRAPISLDGDLSDWDVVLGNVSNATCDGDASSLPCAVSSDRDCPVNRPANDLGVFAWTWDDVELYLYVARRAPQTGPGAAWVYVDTDDDGLQEAGEPVVRLDMASGFVNVHDYLPASPAGDPVTDLGGWSDGHALAGDKSLLPRAFRFAPLIDDMRFEAAVPWTDLRVPPGAAIGLHAALSSGDSIPSTITDNAGAPDGRARTTGWRELLLLPSWSEQGGAPGTQAWLPLEVRNGGNVPTLPWPSLAAVPGHRISLWRDDDGDGSGDVRLAIDAEGDGSLLGPGDVLHPEGDSDGDGRLDLGSIAGGGSVSLVLEVEVPPGDPGGRIRIDVAARDAVDATTMAAATLVLHVGSVTIEPDRSIVAAGGSEARCAHRVRNNGAAAEVVDLSIVSAFAWPWTLLADPAADGDPSGDPPVLDSDGSGWPDVAVPAGGYADVLMVSSVSPTAPAGFQERVLLRAFTGGALRALADDVVTVMRAADLAPNHLAVESREMRAAAGGSIYFPHRLLNALAAPEAFTLSASSPEGWAVSFFTDPDRDGRPHDAGPLGASTPPVPGNGGTYDFFVRLDVPTDALPPASTRVTVTAAGVTTASARDDAFDEAVAAIVSTWEDGGHLASLRETTPCSTVHALATNLPRSTTGLRFVWRDGSGLATEVTTVASDDSGRAEDARDLGGAETGAGLGVEVQLADGTTLDRAAFDVVDPVAVEAFVIPPGALPLEGVVRAALDVVNVSFMLAAQDVVLSWRVLSQDSASYLDASGAFAPFTGVEATAVATIPRLGREARLSLGLAAPASFPGAGTYRLQAWISTACAPPRLAGEIPLDVIADRDGDGLSDAAEAGAGTSPDDADVDDDGLLDGEDGLGDADADGAIDARDCDADDDGLVDGLEAGVTSRHPATDPAAGCFVADADPSTTTDADASDTDAGGAPDGLEDRDRDGVRDPGELDPLDGSDDSMGCSLSPPDEITGLRVSKVGGTSARIAWPASSDPCVAYTVLRSDGLPTFVASAVGLTVPALIDGAALGSRLRAYAVRGESWLTGAGP